jgi:hypothetical protein
MRSAVIRCSEAHSSIESAKVSLMRFESGASLREIKNDHGYQQILLCFRQFPSNRLDAHPLGKPLLARAHGGCGTGPSELVF